MGIGAQWRAITGFVDISALKSRGLTRPQHPKLCSGEVSGHWKPAEVAMNAVISSLSFGCGCAALRFYRAWHGLSALICTRWAHYLGRCPRLVYSGPLAHTVTVAVQILAGRG